MVVPIPLVTKAKAGFIFVSMSSMFKRLAWRISCEVITDTGTGLSFILRWVPVPVTTTWPTLTWLFSNRIVTCVSPFLTVIDLGV